MNLREYHRATNHSLESVSSNRHGLDWPNRPLPFKMYTTLEPLALPSAFSRSALPALSAIAGVERASAPEAVTLERLARLCYFSNGVTRVLRNMPFRAAACTGALYHIELYLICGDLADLEAGVYHYGAHDNALRQLRGGDFRGLLASASGAEPSIAHASALVALTSTWWRNAWKYQARAYRHAFWDSGTILANLLAETTAEAIPTRLVMGFADAPLNGLLDVDPAHEATVCLVALTAGSPSIPAAPDEMPPLHLPTRPLSASEVEYPLIVEAHTASSLDSGVAAAAWRRRHPISEAAVVALPADAPAEPIEAVILRRGSSRRFSHAPITASALDLMLQTATSPTPADAFVATQPYLIVNAVDGLAAGAYAFDRQSRSLEAIKLGDFRREATFLDLGQELGGDAAVNVYWLAAIDDLDDRAYRAAQLLAAVEGGRLYLAAYSLGLGATGLTFFDDDVTRFFSPHAARKSVMFLTAVGHPPRRR